MPKNIPLDVIAGAVDEYRAGVDLPCITGIVAGALSRTTLINVYVRPEDRDARKAARAGHATRAATARRTQRQQQAPAPLSAISIHAYSPAQKGAFGEIAIKARLIAIGGVPRSSGVQSDSIDILFDASPEWGDPRTMTFQIKKATQKYVAGSDDPADQIGTPTVSLTKHAKQTPIDPNEITAVIGYDDVKEAAYVFPLSSLTPVPQGTALINPALQSTASCVPERCEAWHLLMTPEARARLNIPEGPWRFDQRTLTDERARRLAELLVHGQAQREGFYASTGEWSSDVSVHNPERILEARRRLRCVPVVLRRDGTVVLTPEDTEDVLGMPWDDLALWDTDSDALAAPRIALIPRSRWVAGVPLTVRPSDWNRRAVWTALGHAMGFDRLDYARRRQLALADGRAKRRAAGSNRSNRAPKVLPMTSATSVPIAAVPVPLADVVPPDLAAYTPNPDGFSHRTLAIVESHLQQDVRPPEAPTNPDGPPPRAGAGGRHS